MRKHSCGWSRMQAGRSPSGFSARLTDMMRTRSRPLLVTIHVYSWCNESNPAKRGGDRPRSSPCRKAARHEKHRAKTPETGKPDRPGRFWGLREFWEWGRPSKSCKPDYNTHVPNFDFCGGRHLRHAVYARRSHTASTRPSRGVKNKQHRVSLGSGSSSLPVESADNPVRATPPALLTGRHLPQRPFGSLEAIWTLRKSCDNAHLLCVNKIRNGRGNHSR